MKTLALAVALLAACGCQPGVHTPVEGPRPGVSPVAYAISRTLFLEDSGCTGVDLGAGLAATAKHCVADVELGQAYEGGVLVHLDEKADFALYVRLDLSESFKVKMRDPQVGEHLYLVGYPMQFGGGQALTVTDGIYTGVVDGDDQMRITAASYFGNSGGGVWGDDGALLGILSSGYFFGTSGQFKGHHEAQTFIVPSSRIVPAI